MITLLLLLTPTKQISPQRCWPSHPYVYSWARGKGGRRDWWELGGKGELSFRRCWPEPHGLLARATRGIIATRQEGRKEGDAGFNVAAVMFDRPYS